MILVCMLAAGSPFPAHPGLATVTRILGTAPVPDVAPGPQPPPAAVAPAAPPEAAPAVPDVPDVPDDSSPPPPPPTPCAGALAWVAAAGLPLPDAVDYDCPSRQFPHQGAACWYGPACPQRGLIAINMDRLVGTTTDYLHHVVAHEMCHIFEFQATGRTSEESADACAAAHGAPA